MDNVGKLALPREQMDRIWALYRSHPTVGACTQIISHAVFSGGVLLDGNKTRLHTVATCAQKALDWLLCIGIVPIVLTGETEMEFVVPEHENVQIFVQKLQNGGVSFSASLVNRVGAMSMFGTTNGEDLAVIVWSQSATLPDVCGNITTPLSRIVHLEEFVSFMRLRTMVAEQIRTNPPFVSQSRPVRNNDTEGVTWNVDDAAVIRSETERLRSQQIIEQTGFEMHSAYWAGATGGVPIDKHTRSSFHKDCKPTEYYIGSERDYVRAAVPDSPIGHLRNFSADVEDAIMRLMGVPKVVFETHASRSGVSMQEFAFNNHVYNIKGSIEQMLNQLLQLIKSCTKCTDINNIDNMETSPDQQRETVQIPGACFVNTDLASQMHAEGLMTREEYMGIMRAAVGLAGKKRTASDTREEKAPQKQKTESDGANKHKDEAAGRKRAGGSQKTADQSIRGKVNASNLNYAKEAMGYMREQSAVLHPKGRLVVAPNGAGKSYYVEHQAQKDWLDQDPYLEQVDIPTKSSDKLSEATMQQADKATLALKRAGAWVLGATWWDPANVDAFVIPSAAVTQTRLAAKSDKFDKDFYEKNVQPHIETIRKVAKEHEIPIYDSFEDIVVS